VARPISRAGRKTETTSGTETTTTPPADSSAPAPTTGGANTVSGEGFGPVKFGMKVDEAEKLLGIKLRKEANSESEECRYATPVDALPGVNFMLAKDVVVRVDVSEGGTTTAEGAKIGDTESHVLELYKGRSEVQPHKYTGPEGHYVVVKGADGKVNMVFETDGKVVVQYRAGFDPQVQYVEGCS
jgi:hypothetical protein